MISMEEGEKQPPLAVMGFALRMQHAFPKHGGLTWWDLGFCVVLLVGHHVCRLPDDWGSTMPGPDDERGPRSYVLSGLTTSP